MAESYKGLKRVKEGLDICFGDVRHMVTSKIIIESQAQAIGPTLCTSVPP